MRAAIAAVCAGIALVSGNVAAEASPAIVPATRVEQAQSFAPVVAKTAPAVVNIFARKLVHNSGSPPAFHDTALWRLFSDAFLFGYGARDRISNSLGSGVIVRPDGIIVTNHHVIADAQGILVGLADDRVFPAEIIVSDRRTDIAVLRVAIPGEVLPTLEFADSDRLSVGDIVLAIGNPFGLGQSVSSGIVSALARSGAGTGDFRFFIQTDAAINPGNSGGALIAMDGRLIGINTAIFARSGGSQGVGFAVPVNMVRAVVDAAVSGRNLVRPWIGISGIRMPPQLALMMGLRRPGGVLVTQTHAGGPAAAAGIVPGDVILAVGDFVVDDFAMLRYRIATRPVGDSAQLVILRRGRQLEIEVQPAPPPDNPPRHETWLRGIHVLAGARVANMSPAFAEDLGVDSVMTGVAVLEVSAGSGAARLGLRAGDIIHAFQDAPLATIAELRAIAIPPLRSWRLMVNRGGRELAIGAR